MKPWKKSICEGRLVRICISCFASDRSKEFQRFIHSCFLYMDFGDMLLFFEELGVQWVGRATRHLSWHVGGYWFMLQCTWISLNNLKQTIPMKMWTLQKSTRRKRLVASAQEDLFSGLSKLKVLWLTGNHYQVGEKGYKKMKAGFKQT